MNQVTVTKTAKSAATTNATSLSRYVPKRLDVDFSGRISTALDAIDSGYDNMYSLRKIFGDDKIQNLIKAHLVMLDELMNLSRPLTETIIDFTATAILAEFSCLNMADVWLVFNRAKTGVYGKIMTLNTADIVKWFRDYFNERCDVAEERSQREAAVLKASERTGNRIGGKDEAFKEFKRKWKIEQMRNNG